MKKKKRWNSQRASETIRRKDEIERYGKLVSLRPTLVMKSKKKYTRKQKHKKNND